MDGLLLGISMMIILFGLLIVVPIILSKKEERKNETRPQIVKFADDTYGIMRKNHGQTEFMDRLLREWWDMKNEYEGVNKFCKFKTFKDAKEHMDGKIISYVVVTDESETSST